MSKKFKIIVIIFFLSLSFSGLYLHQNFYKFKAIFFEKRWEFFQEKILAKNAKIIELQNQGKIKFEDNDYNFIKFSLEENGLYYRDDYIYRPIGYFDILNDRIIFAAHDGNFYYTNKINEIKEGKFDIKKLSNSSFDFKFNINDEDPYRSILIRDIFIDKKDLYVVINGRKKINSDEYSLSTSVLKGNINFESKKINFKKFFEPNESIIGSTDFSHSGGRIVKFKDDKFLLTVPDHALMDDYQNFIERMNSNKSIIGKIILIDGKSYEVFSYGHRNPQGLFYDKKNDLIFETEHGPTGGDEINLIKKGNHYGWPLATYGAKIEKLNLFRSHKKNNFTEPLTYWWPRNCGMSEIVKVEANFNKNWEGYNLLNACLSGSGANQGESIYRWKFDPKKQRLTKNGQYHIGDRIRDMKYSNKNEALLLLLEDQKSIAIIFKD
tara:strand:+ start:755 stop:2065 length:1311 start_codon:yes stop_codon:yes gene_type:complete